MVTPSGSGPAGSPAAPVLGASENGPLCWLRSRTSETLLDEHKGPTWQCLPDTVDPRGASR